MRRTRTPGTDSASRIAEHRGLIARPSLPRELQRVVADGSVAAAGLVESVQSRQLHQVRAAGHEHEAERGHGLRRRCFGYGHGASLRRWQRTILAKSLVWKRPSIRPLYDG